MTFRTLDEKVLVSGQILPAQITDAAAQGVTMIINNRPDGEEEDQPTAASIEAASRAAGVDYCHIPVAGGLSPGQAEAMADAIEASDGKALAFCRSGTRSAYLWALARSSRGWDAEALVRQAASAGYDLRPILPHLRG